jgi:hypothetical protein
MKNDNWKMEYCNTVDSDARFSKNYSGAVLPALNGAFNRGGQSRRRPIAGEEEVVEPGSA